jgi:hypothetical protein
MIIKILKMPLSDKERFFVIMKVKIWHISSPILNYLIIRQTSVGLGLMINLR